MSFNSFMPQQNAPKAAIQRSGVILRDYGAPLDTVGEVGNVYIDVSQNPPNMYLKRQASGNLAPWGEYIWTLPSESGPPVNLWANLKYYGDTPPYPESPAQYGTPTVGVTGDYYIMWQGPNNPGVAPRLFGPKGYSNAPGWPEDGWGPTITQAPVSYFTRTGVANTGAPTVPPNNEDAPTPTNPVFYGVGSVILEGVMWFGNSSEVVASVGAQTTSIPTVGLSTLGIEFPGTLNANWDAGNPVVVDNTTIAGNGTPNAPLHTIGAGTFVATTGQMTGNGTSGSPLGILVTPDGV